jgi:hypothetical protein
MSKFGQLLGISSAAPAPEVTAAPAPAPEPVVEEPKRARDENGHFVADDPSTPENEAWEGGVSPKKTRKRTHRTK